MTEIVGDLPIMQAHTEFLVLGFDLAHHYFGHLGMEPADRNPHLSLSLSPSLKHFNYKSTLGREGSGFHSL